MAWNLVMPALLEYIVKHSADTPSQPSHKPGQPSKPIQSRRPFCIPAYNSEEYKRCASAPNVTTSAW
eukprot:2839389-Pleurochrysis_carterae.AAC.1